MAVNGFATAPERVGNMKTNGQNGMAKKNAEHIWVNRGEPQRQ